MMLNDLSWSILTAKQVLTRDLDLALDAAKAANDASHGEDPSIIDTYARALWDTGSKADAVKLQRKAVELANSPRLKKALQKTLEEYEAER